MFLKRVSKIPLFLAVVTLISALFLALFAFQSVGSPKAGAADDCQTFQTGYQVCGRFLTYWRQNGGLAQQGNPISAVFEEQNASPPAGDGKVHRVQYFERARFEEHTENQAPYDVLLGLVGTEQFRERYGVKDPNAQLLIIRGKRTETTLGDHVPQPGWVYLVVDLLVTNTTDKQLVVSPDSITLRTAQIYDYKVNAATYASERYLKLSTLSINQNVGGELAFMIPQTDTPASITLDYFDNKITVNFP